jgi:protein TonB
MFDQIIVPCGRPSRTDKRWTVMLSAIGQSVLLSLLVLEPLVYTEALPNGMLKTILVAPPPPTAPTAPTPVRTANRAVVIPLGGSSPRPVISASVSRDPGESVEYVDVGPSGNTGNTPLTDLFHNLPPPPQAAQQTQRIRVGGGVEAASIINRVMPQYPAIAKTAHVSGTIVLHAIIAKDGTVQELTYISGSPLLIKAAIDAVREWRYRPTMLNGEPVEVETTIVVVFNLGG